MAQAEIKNAKIELVTPNGTWQTSDGSKTFFKFEVSFDNGDVGEYSSIHKEQNKFELGTTVDYEYYGGKFPKIKPVYAKPPTPFSGGVTSFGKSEEVQTKIVRQSMLKASVDFWAIEPKLKPSIDDVLKTAERFVQFVNGNDAVQFSKEFSNGNVVNDLEATPKELKEDNLPF